MILFRYEIYVESENKKYENVNKEEISEYYGYGEKVEVSIRDNGKDKFVTGRIIDYYRYENTYKFNNYNCKIDTKLNMKKEH